MEVSFGFFIILLLIVFPGLIYRRLYFYGEFSKEFMSGYNVAGVLALSVIPGVAIVSLSLILYHFFFCNLNLAQVVDTYKEVANPDVLLKASNGLTHDKFNGDILRYAMPFVMFEYLTAFLFGSVLGRLVRITRIDTKFKLLRFKNHWFYTFHGQYKGFKKFGHLDSGPKSHLFTKADILIDTNSGPRLYSGIVVDYELNENESCTLSKVYLRNAERYSKKDDKHIKVDIPGELLVIDCTTLININLTYVYESRKTSIQSRWPERIDLLMSLLILGLIPFFIFRIEWIENKYYQDYFMYTWYKKIAVYFFFIQSLSLLNPYVKLKDGYKYIGWKVIIAKIAWIALLYFIIRST